MKFLMIGMDGAHIEVFNRGWTPFIENLMRDADHLPINEDLIGRGWSHIALGQHASVTGALYDRPDLDGTHGWSLKFKITDVPGIGDAVKPIWQALGEAGVRVGIMNVPTVFPAPAVNGFCVSGGGGGGPVLQDPTPELCYPREILPKLLDLGYIVDERPSSLLAEKGLTLPSQVFERLALKNEKRTDAFIYLSEKFDVEFGFVVFKSSSVFAELLVLAEQAAAKRSGLPADRQLMAAAEAYYRKFDKQIERLFASFPDAEIVFVSDHGSVAPETYFNPNALLMKLGFQPKHYRKRAMTAFVQAAKKLIPYSLRLRLRKNTAINKGWAAISTAPPPGSKAFSAVLGSWRHGIFINDFERFGGSVDPSRIDEVAEEVVASINNDPEAIRNGISAAVRPNDRSSGAPQFPDVILSMPDQVVSSTGSKRPFAPFVMPPSPLGLRTVTDGALLTIKSSNALAAHVTGHWVRNGQIDPTSLTTVYAHVLERFGVS